MELKSCLHCNKEFAKPYYYSKKEWGIRKYCSHACGYANKTVMKQLNHCFKCGIDFIANAKRKYCSLTCKNQIPRGGMIKSKCMQCTKEFTHKRSVPRFYCSSRCVSDFKKGKNHWNWKGGISPVEKSLRQSEVYNNWRKSVYARDYWTCQHCLIKQKNPVAHHIKTWKEYPELRYEITNGMTLCRPCHKKVHSEMGMTTRFSNKVIFA